MPIAARLRPCGYLSVLFHIVQSCVGAGLAGVYDIGDHYDFESWRGVEDISAMARAAYGLEHFGRFSPTHIVSSLPPRTRSVCEQYARPALLGLSSQEQCFVHMSF